MSAPAKHVEELKAKTETERTEASKPITFSFSQKDLETLSRETAVVHHGQLTKSLAEIEKTLTEKKTLLDKLRGEAEVINEVYGKYYAQDKKKLAEALADLKKILDEHPRPPIKDPMELATKYTYGTEEYRKAAIALCKIGPAEINVALCRKNVEKCELELKKIADSKPQQNKLEKEIDELTQEKDSIKKSLTALDDKYTISPAAQFKAKNAARAAEYRAARAASAKKP